MSNRLPTPKGHRKLKRGEIIEALDVFWVHGTPAKGLGDGYRCTHPVGRAWPTEPTQTQYYRAIESTQKPKEPKTMTTKKPNTSHGKPTAKGLRVEKKPTAAKVSKYPAPRVQRELETDYGDMTKKTKVQLIDFLTWTSEEFRNLAADHCIAGTELDRALVDLKEAKKRIKELSKELEAAK